MATLASTLVGTFTASMGLWERVHDRRESHKQKLRDTKQDGEIKQLREQFEKAQHSADGRQQEIDRLKAGGGERGGDRGGGGRDDPGRNFERDGMMIQRMYDEGYGRMGNRFAQGDGMYCFKHLKRAPVFIQVLMLPQLLLKTNCRLTSSPFNKLSSTFFKMHSTTIASSLVVTWPNLLRLQILREKGPSRPCARLRTVSVLIKAPFALHLHSALLHHSSAALQL